MNKTIIGLVGPIKAGKGTVAKYIYGEFPLVSVYRFSKILADILKILSFPDTRENLQNLAIDLRKRFGAGILAEAVKTKIRNDLAGVILIDGIRAIEEADMVKSLGGIIIYITAPTRVRYARLDDQKLNEKLISFEDFLMSENKETEILINQIGQKADFIIENQSSIKDLYDKLDAILKEVIK